MSREPRKKSSTGIYHVMFRGINGQIIFEDNEDFNKFLETIREYKEVSEYEIYAYCLMSNHIHLLIKEGKEDLGIAFRRIGASYVYWYNMKYKRRGHLFQDRYKSEVVEKDEYFLTLVRYIHLNPIKAGIEKDIAKYQWSSYHEYMGESSICNTGFTLSLFAGDKDSAIVLFKEFNTQENDDKCLEYEDVYRLDDIEAKELIMKVAGVEDPKQIREFEKEKREKIINGLKNSGLSIRQIERLTGVSFGMIRGKQHRRTVPV